MIIAVKKARPRSALQRMDADWFANIESEVGQQWPEHLRGGLRGAVLIFWQEAKKWEMPEIDEQVAVRQKSGLKLKALAKAFAATDSIYQDWLARELGMNGADELSARLSAALASTPPDPVLPGMICPDWETSRPVDGLILSVVQLHVATGGRPEISNTGPLAKLLRLVHEMLPANTAPSTPDALVKQAELTRAAWQRHFKQFQCRDLPKERSK